MTDITELLIERLTKLERKLAALERREYTSGGGLGDMTKAVYDPDADGRVSLAADADTVDSQHAAAFAPAAKGVTNGDSHDHSGGDGGQVDHGGLAGLADDDHSQYYNQTRGDARYAPIAKGVTNGDSHDHAGGDGGQIDHGGLTGLGDDDHTQYLLAAGSRALSGDWDVGNFTIQAKSFISDIAPGTSPWMTTSDTLNVNLNADLLDGRHAATMREKLTSNRTYYVRTDGNDSNTGLVNNSGGAFLTIQAAVNAASFLDLGGYTVTIQVGDGTYTGAVTLKNVVGFSAPGNLVIQGNSGTPTNVVISTTNASCFTADGISSIWLIKDLRVQTTTNGSGVEAMNNAAVQVSGIDCGACAGNYHGHFTARSMGVVQIVGNYTISGNCYNHIYTITGSVYSQDLTATISANITVTHFVRAIVLGSIVANGMTYSLGAYSVTGQRYYAITNGVIMTSGGGANFFPGNSAGATATGGQYA